MSNIWVFWQKEIWSKCGQVVLHSFNQIIINLILKVSSWSFLFDKEIVSGFKDTRYYFTLNLKVLNYSFKADSYLLLFLEVLRQME